MGKLVKRMLSVRSNEGRLVCSVTWRGPFDFGLLRDDAPAARAAAAAVAAFELEPVKPEGRDDEETCL